LGNKVELLKANSEIYSLNEEVAKHKATIDEQKKAIQHLKSTNDILSQQINDNKKVILPKLSARGKIRRGKSFFRVDIPDVHGNHMNKPAVECMLNDFRMLGIGKGDTVIQGGDLVDCAGFLAQHHTLGVVAEVKTTSYAQDIASANWFIDELMAATNGAEYHFLEGNHEERVEKWCVTQSLRHEEDSQLLLDNVGVESLLSLKSRGIPYYRVNEKHCGQDVPGLIQLGKCYYTHGSFAPLHAAKKYADTYNVNIVYHHTHRRDVCYKDSVGSGEIIASNSGTLSVIQPFYAHARPTGWTTGYGLQIVSEDGNFINLNIPIIEGKSLLYALLESRK
jgi:hypothetical protein